MSKKRRIPFADIARRITGISTPVFGVSWNPAEDKREIVRRLVAFLEDRRALYANFHMEYGPWVEKSVLEMRAELTDILKACSEDEELAGPIRAMRAACRKFLDQTGHPGGPRRMLYPHEAAMWHTPLVKCGLSSACIWRGCVLPTVWTSNRSLLPSSRELMRRWRNDE